VQKIKKSFNNIKVDTIWSSSDKKPVPNHIYQIEALILEKHDLPPRMAEVDVFSYTLNL